MTDRLSELVVEQLHLPEGTVVSEDTSFKDDIRAASFEMMELFMAIEEEYGVQFDDEEMEGFDTIGDVLRNIKRKGVDLD